jgi:AcrR family transcriptional regulator
VSALPPDRRILDAAVRVFGRSGYAGATTDEVAREAGLTKGAIYWYFQDKHALFQEAVVYVVRSWQAAVAGGHDAEAVWNLLIRYGAEQPAFLTFLHRLHGEFAAMPDSADAAPLREWYRTLVERLGAARCAAWWATSHPLLARALAAGDDPHGR